MKTLAPCVLLLAVSLSLCGASAAQDPDVSGSGSCATLPCTTTYHNNNSRTGVNPLETILKPSVLPTLSKDFPLDSLVYAQPLYVSSVAFSGGPCTSGTTRGIAYVVTENNTIYAIDADNYQECTHVNLNNTGETAIPVSALPGGPCDNLTGSSSNGTVGITGTPAIDPANNVIFFVTAHKVPDGHGGYNYTQRLQARKLTDLTQWDVLDIPGMINRLNTSSPTFYALNESQRAGLLLTANSSGANVVVAWGTFCDANTSVNGSAVGSFGLVAEFDFSYSTHTFNGNALESFYPLATYTNISTNPQPNGPAGVWMSGGAPAADAGGNVYVGVGNGNFEAVTTPFTYGESVVKLSSSSLGVLDYYTPNDWVQLNQGSSNQSVGCAGVGQPSCLIGNGGLVAGDWDLGSGGVVLLTKSSSTAYGELVAAGKEGMFYVTWYCSSSTCPATLPLTWNTLMGGLDGAGYGHDTSGTDWRSYGCTPAGSPGNGKLAQCLYIVPVTSRAESGERGTPAFWAAGGSTGSYLYTVGTGNPQAQVPSEYLKAFKFTSGMLATTWAQDSNVLYGYPGATPTVSWDGTNATTGLVWVWETDTWSSGSNNRGILRAYQATPSGSPPSMLLKWTSTSTTGPGAVKFSVPTVANGKVFVAGEEVSSTPKGCGRTSGCAGLLTIFH